MLANVFVLILNTGAKVERLLRQLILQPADASLFVVGVVQRSGRNRAKAILTPLKSSKLFSDNREICSTDCASVNVPVSSGLVSADESVHQRH